MVIRLSGRTLKTVPSAKWISAVPPPPVRTRSFWRRTRALLAAIHSSVPACFTWTLPSMAAKRAPVSTAADEGGGVGGVPRQ